MLTPSTYVRVLGCTLLVAAGACGDDGGSTDPPTTGTLEITTATTGTEPDADGYSVVVDAAAPSTIGASATMTASGVAPGTHTVQLSGIAPNCAPAGDNPQTVTVTAGEVTRVSFAMTCNASTGTLSVIAATSGPSPDPDGYAVTIDGIGGGALAVNGSVTLNELMPGGHVVGLSGLAANCQIQGENPRTIATSAGGNPPVEFAVSCAAPPPDAGTLRVTTATSGPDADPDGYTFVEDGGASQPIGLNATATLANTAPGAHTVRLSGVSSNCTVQGANPRSVTVTGGAAADVSFAITCSATSGAIRINVTTSGSPTDPDGYVAKLDGADPGKPVATSGNGSFSGVPAGSHSVALSGVAINCSVADGTSRTVTVTVGATAEVNFSVTCTAATGSIKITTSTTGSSADDGYTVGVDDAAPQAIGANDEGTVPNIAAGDHRVTLGEIASNCTVDGENPRSVTVAAGTESAVGFTLTCTAPVGSLIAFTSNGVEPGGALVNGIFVVNPDGSGMRSLSPAGSSESNPVWSPDEQKILFSRGQDLYVMNADGGGRARLAGGRVGLFDHKWSGDGQMIAYIDSYVDGDDLVSDLWVIRSDGTGAVKIAGNASNFSWSPDTRIVYGSVADLGDVHLRIINADGSGDSRLTTRAAFQPAWSPDGAIIAFVTLGDKEIFLINPDGTGEVNLTQGRSRDDEPTWSPDGSKIVFSASPLDNQQETDIAVMNRDGSNRTILTNNPGIDFGADWSPDGGKLVFIKPEGRDTEIYIMNPDGGNQTNVSQRPSTRETQPDWDGQGPATAAGHQSVSFNNWLRARELEARRPQ